MLEIFVDILDNKIIGYNEAIYDTPVISNTSYIIQDDTVESYIKEHMISKNLYYINGTVVEVENDSADEETDLATLSAAASELEPLVQDEQKIFIDNIISGMSLEEAITISKENRENLESINKQMAKYDNKTEKKRRDKMNEIFITEESKIKYKYFLSMVTIVRDENDYLAEWIRYHIEEVGFDHFYIYDNESKISVVEYLQSIDFKYADRVTVIDWPTSTMSQQDSHNDFLKRFKHETKWFIGMDPDEYIVIKNPGKTLVEFLEEHSDCAAIKCLWKHYNANGHETKTDEPDMVRFTQETDWEDYKHGGKRFAQSNRISHFSSYVPIIRHYAKEIDYENEAVRNFFQFNHYYTRSYEEWVQKIKRGSSNPTFLRKYSNFFELNPDMEYLNTGKDFSQGYGPAIKEEEVTE